MIHGVLLINKTSGGTSHDTVSSLRKILDQKQVGHGGTLDPMAEGLLLILLGQGTKLSQYLLPKDKRYQCTLKLGLTTDTLDKTGQVLSQKPVHCTKQEVQKVIKDSQGRLSLPVPLFSAVKIKGRKLYEYGRAKQNIELPKRIMFFYDLNIHRIQKDQVEIEISCCKGSYIRSWTAFVGHQLKTGACLEKLTRIRSEPFSLKSALTLKEITEKLKTQKNLSSTALHQTLGQAFVPFSKSLPHIKALSLPEETKSLRHGQIPPQLLKLLKETQKKVNQAKKNLKVRIMSQDNHNMLALLELKPFKTPQILRVFFLS